jgi:general secretion pathway protein G
MIDKIRKFVRGEKGFTLVEMMVVLIIIAVLIALGIRMYIGYIGNSKLTSANNNITNMQAALDSYYQQNQAYPTTTSGMAAAGLSSYLVTNNGAIWCTGANPSYTYRCTTSSTYAVYLTTQANGMYEEGGGTSGISAPAVSVASIWLSQ